MMQVQAAKAVARQWIIEEGSRIPGFAGAFFHGSSNWLADDAWLPASSDLDVMVVLEVPDPPVKPGKFIYQGVLLEISYIAHSELATPEQVLGQSHLAGSFAAPGVIADPLGWLIPLQQAVAENYAKAVWVRQRCHHARAKVLNNLAGIHEAAPWPDQVLAWLFGTSVTTHILLVAGLKNPTVRRRYVDTKALLTAYQRLDVYESLLALLGCAQISRSSVETHLDAMTAAFDAADVAVKTSFFFATDLSQLARPIAVDGSRTLIEQGLYREAVFWIAATYSRCQKVFTQDAPSLLAEHHPGYQRLLADLGIVTTADLLARSEQVRQFLPQIWAVAEQIMAANPQIDHRSVG